jgi:hypothetical protein
MDKLEIVVSETVARGVEAIYRAGFEAGEKHARSWERRLGSLLGGVFSFGIACFVAALIFFSGAHFGEWRVTEYRQENPHE